MSDISSVSQRLLTTEETAAKLGISPSGVRKSHSAGRLPLPIHLGRSVRWSESELDEWIAAGCPPRGKWMDARESMKATAGKAGR